MVLSLRTKLTASIVVVVLVMGVVSTIVGTRLFGGSLVREVQRNVEHDLDTAELVYETRLGAIDTYVRFVAGEPRVARALRTGSVQDLLALLTERREAWELDLLTATDARGVVIARSRADAETGDDVSADQVVSRTLSTRRPVAGTVLVDLDELEAESPELAEQARMRVLETPHARPSDRSVLEEGMLLKAAAPVVADGELVGTIYGGVLLNQRRDIVDQVKETAYKGETWKGKDIGASTIFQDDVRIATNVLTADGNLAFGTRVSQEVYDRVVGSRSGTSTATSWASSLWGSSRGSSTPCEAGASGRSRS